ncbi:acetyl-CoA carboxylase biotin carboxyl carrier protein [Pseudonocardia sulfidoxydans]|uniref:acetyl-CoA carboxylase biotin carboxyl carrier protein n=1 Tax=Pseudonocardia sulfidoxydans TaxID=54011 RepID=UPI0035EFDA2C
MNAPTDEDRVPDSVTYREIQEILRSFRDSGWTGMTVDLHGMRITVGKNGPPAAPAAPAPIANERHSGATELRDSAVRAAPEAAPAAAPPAAPAAAPPGNERHSGATQSRDSVVRATPGVGGGVDTTGCVAVSSPAVGAFWVAPSPGQPPFVAVGDTVTHDQQLAIVEVMKLMNPVVAPVAGTVVQVCAANADLVEFEQTLFLIRPADG